MKNIFAVILFLSFAFGFGQDNTAPKENEKLIKKDTTDNDNKSEYIQVFTSVDVQAQPSEGMNAFRKYIASSFRLPEVTEKTMGKVIVKFVIWDDGSIKDVVVVTETPSGLGLGKEAVRVINGSAKWTPAELNGRKVKQYFTLPIVIELPASKKAKQ